MHLQHTHTHTHTHTYMYTPVGVNLTGSFAEQADLVSYDGPASPPWVYKKGSAASKNSFHTKDHYDKGSSKSF